MKTWVKDTLIGAGGALIASSILALNFENVVDWIKPDLSIPSGAIIAVSGNDGCPSRGWEVAPETQGRYIVGRHYETIEKTIEPVGRPLTPLENRASGKHDHPTTRLGIVHNGSSNDGLATEFRGSSNVKINVSLPGATGVSNHPDGTNAPYIAYFLCRKV